MLALVVLSYIRQFPASVLASALCSAKENTRYWVDVMYLMVKPDVQRKASLTTPAQGPLVVRQQPQAHNEVSLDCPADQKDEEQVLLKKWIRWLTQRMAAGAADPGPGRQQAGRGLADS